MIDKTKQVILLVGGGLLVATFLLTIGFNLGGQSSTKVTERAIAQKSKALASEQVKKDKESVLSQEQVEEFLVQYYTKKQLWENNARLKPYLTDSAYREELVSQEELLQQVYKDYILDYRFEGVTIYVNPKTNEALAEVSYTVTYVADLEHKDQAQTNQVEKRTVKLAYTKVGDKLLVNHLKTIQTPLEDLLNKAQVTSPSSESSAVPELPHSTTTP